MQIQLADCEELQSYDVKHPGSDEAKGDDMLNPSFMAYDVLWNKGLTATRSLLLEKPDFSPFTHPLYPTKSCYGWFKVIFFTVTLIAPARLLMFVVLQTMSVIIGYVAGCGISETTPRKCWREPLLLIIVLIDRVLLLIYGYYWIPINGRLEKESRVIVSNHVGAVDRLILKWMCFCKEFSAGPSFIAKSSLKNTPLGILGKCEQTIWVDRSSDESRQAAKKAICDRAKDKAMPRLLIFAEGTTKTPNVLLQFKPGAFMPGEPVAPVCISFLNSKGGGTQEMSFRRLFDDFYIPLCNFINFARVDILPTYYPDEQEKTNPKLFAQNVRSLMHKELCRHFPSASLSELTNGDTSLRTKSMSLKTETQVQLEEFVVSDLYEKIGLKTFKIAIFMELYDELTIEGQKLSLKDFQRILEDTHSDKQVEFLFEFIKHRKTGAVGLLQFIIFFAIVEGSDVKTPTRANDLLHFAFAGLVNFERDIPTVRRSDVEKSFGSEYGVIWHDLDWIGVEDFLSRGSENINFLQAARLQTYGDFLLGLKHHAPRYYSKQSEIKI